MRHITPEQLQEILDQHRLWTTSNGQQGQRADLSGANLRGADLAGADLTEADLARADLYDADLTGAILTEACLYGACLVGANLTIADLGGANLTGADLSHTCVISFQICRYFGYYHRGTVRIGCEEFSLAYWLDNYKDIGQAHGYSPAETEAIGMQLRTIKRQAKLLQRQPRRTLCRTYSS